MRLYEAISIRIKEICTRDDITINALANKCGLPSSDIKNILYGKSTNPGVRIILNICNAVDMSLAEFFNAEVFKDYKHFEDLL